MSGLSTGMSDEQRDPENALRQANGFVNLGKKQRALAVLQNYVGFSKNRVWSECFEQMMHKYMELCVDLRQPNVAKEGLRYYRRMCQQTNIESLEKVVVAFLQLGEQKTLTAKMQSQDTDEETAEDLYEAESPEKLLLSAATGEAVQGQADKSVLIPWLRFLWESYKACLQLFRSKVSMELLYHRVARLACIFCLRYRRKTELRKLSEWLRAHFAQLNKQRHSSVESLSPQTITLCMDTRVLQLVVAVRLESWQEAIKRTDDVHKLFVMSGHLPDGPILATFYEMLALLFWKTKESLYHATALLKLFQLRKENRKNWLEKMPDEATHLATRVLLATISIQAVESANILSRHLDVEDSKADRQRGLASLLGVTGFQSRRTLFKEMAHMGVNACALPAAQSLYNIFESNNNPLTLAADVHPHLESIQKTGKSEYTQYIEPLQEVLTIKILKQLSQVYKSLSMNKLYTLIPFFDANKLENDIAYAGWKNVVKVRINYLKQSLDFGVEESFTLRADAEPSAESLMFDFVTLRHTVSSQINGNIQKMHDCLKEAVQATCSVADAELRSVIADLHKFQRYHTFADYVAILERRRCIETYKEEMERTHLEIVCSYNLLNVGKKQHALAALQDFINFSKNRVWSKCFEQIMHKYMELCVDLRRPHIAKDGLFQYRRMCQQINVKSLEEVVLAFLELGEKKAAIAKAESQGVAEEIAEDLDQAESPERLLLSAVSGEGAQDRADRSILSPWLRFLWESYRQCLELLRNNVQVELLYHRVARLAFLFCLRYQRKAEFRKLSENLRTHLAQLQKHQQSHFNIKLSNPETIALHQETRILQLDVAIQLESWQEAIKSTDDVQQLFAISGRLPKGPNLASYYEKLALIFWKARDSLYHASALLKLFQLCKENRKNWLEKMSDDATHLATRVLLAIISIRAVESPAILSRHLDLEDSKADHQRRLASLLRLTGPPSRRTLCKEMARMGVNVCALPAAQSLYSIFESNNNPLTLAADVQPHLESIQETGKSEYTQYIEPLQEVLTIKILKQLSQVYKSLSMNKLYTLIPFFDANKLENDIAYAGWKNVVQMGCLAVMLHLQVRINYLKQSLDFGVEEAFTLASDADPSAESSMLDVAALRHTPCDQIHGYIQKMHNCLKEAVQSTCSVADAVRPRSFENLNYGSDFQELRSVITDLHKMQRYHAFDDHEAILERRRRIETYKEETEKMQLKMEETVRERERYEAEAQRLAEQSRLEQENTERQQAMRRREQEELQKRVVRDRLERMKDPKFRRFLAEMPEEEIENLDNDTLLQKQITHMEQEKREHMAKLRVAEKKWDHMVRALRIEEMPRLVDNYEKEAEMAPTFWMEHEKERVATAIEDRKLYLATHERLKRMQDDANQFKESLKEKTAARFEEKMKQWEQKMQEVRKARLEDRKAKRKEARRRIWLEEKAEAERQKMDEERKRKEEEERSMKQAKYGNYGLRGMDMDKRGAGKDREAEFVGTWERKGPIETKQDGNFLKFDSILGRALLFFFLRLEPFNETWVKGRRLQADMGSQRTLFDSSRGSYRMSSVRSSEVDSEASWQSRRVADGLPDRPRGRVDDVGTRPFAFDRPRNRLAEPEPDLDFSRARMTQKIAEQTDRPQRPGLRPGGAPYGSQDARLQSDPYRRINARDRAGPDDDVTFSRSSFGRKLESDKGNSLSPERSVGGGGGGGPTEARREQRSFGQQQQTNAGVYRPPIGGNRYAGDSRPSFMTRTDQSSRVSGDSWRSGSRGGVDEKSSLTWRRQGQVEPPKTARTAEEREGQSKSTREKPNMADNDLDEGWSRVQRH
ncbi:eukaryotic translation initiation factor 3 [Trichuris trichiura]|uniref:Eukaryotic translation initiation factor 3 n=1 Tax=Trichuris trichiura TaxID=36087 RepID=A0A077ZCW9_TRITR|nr:eukaryotic translation initiation factor 3 [Trichuris trichiura]